MECIEELMSAVRLFEVHIQGLTALFSLRCPLSSTEASFDSSMEGSKPTLATQWGFGPVEAESGKAGFLVPRGCRALARLLLWDCTDGDRRGSATGSGCRVDAKEAGEGDGDLSLE